MEGLIKREDAIALTATFIELNKFKMHNVKDAGRLSHALFSESRIPSADAVEVVRCKDCKYKRINEDGETRYYYCALEDRPNRQWSVDGTDFCSWGEVRDE